MPLPNLTDHQWTQHFERGYDLTKRIEAIPTWTKLNVERRKTILERAREEGIDPGDADAFWRAVRQVATPAKVEKYVDGWSGGKTLETLLRVPKRGNPDHFTRLAEMEDPQVEARKTMRRSHTRNEKEELFRKVYGREADELLDDGGPVSPEEARRLARQVAEKLGRMGK